MNKFTKKLLAASVLFGLAVSQNALAELTIQVQKGDAFVQPMIYQTANYTPTYEWNNSGNRQYVTVESNAPYNINHHLNKIENVNERTLGKLFNKWNSDSKEPIVVAHFGDSHVQTGWQIAPIRQALQQYKGNAGRGMIFPYSIAKTYSQEDYTSSFTGTWRTANSIHQPPKIGVGVSGFVAVTQDAATKVGFNFKKADLGSIQAKLSVRVPEGSYQVTMSNDTTSQTLTVSQQAGTPTQELVFDLPHTGTTLDIRINRQSGYGSFEFHGLNLVKADVTGGVLYHNLGVGGAAFNAIVQQKWFEEQFPKLNADLVILDWGTNNVLYTNQIAGDFERTVRNTIQKVRAANPNATILLASVQEARYKGKNVTVSEDFERLMRRIAQEENCLYYDWYNISGGHNSVNLWKDLGFASKDAIHLNGKGYRVKAQLFANALLNALNGK